MNRMRKVLIAAAALGALAVGGAAFAQAQNASSVVTPVVQQSHVRTREDGSQTGEHGSRAERPDAGPANEVEDGN
jgi:uncharacterized low-complexity protein